MKRNGRMYQFPNGDEFPVVESSSSYLVAVTDEDVKSAVRTDPFACAIACAIKRQVGWGHATVSATRAYMVVRYKGELVAMKFGVPVATREAIRHFDETGEMPSEGIILSALKKSESSAEKKKENAKRSLRAPGASRPATGRRSQPVTFRNLTGRIHTHSS